ncbi:hypothetical protein [Guptibacillus spartinae]|uniref:hypothetical protein n=1 Tax=Guptibacillus spartinae TaxID=3025679 RepID=UPI00235FDFA4|nr:hypothetical protein [Pseudalkalibacillus spartinae]
MKGNRWSKKSGKIVRGLIYAALFIGAIQFWFDRDPFNDYVGYGFLLMFWFIRMVHSGMRNLNDGYPNHAMLDFGLAIMSGLAVLAVWTTYFIGF